MCCLNWPLVRYCILGNERELDLVYNINIRIYGTGHQGYRFLRECLYENSYYKKKEMKANDIWRGIYGTRYKQELRKRVYEYWIFLNLVRMLLSGNTLSQRLDVFYEPCSGSRAQVKTISVGGWNIFVEPSLLPCSRRTIINLMQKCVDQEDVFNSLREVLIQSSNVRNTPDFLISKADKLIWGAMRIVGVFPDNEIEENYRTQRSWQEWRNYWDKIKDCSVIIECKNENINIKDVVQVLWYKLCYDCETILISQKLIPQASYRNILQNCGVHVIEDCKICDDKCIGKLSILKGILKKLEERGC